jgi:hypothetical protein
MKKIILMFVAICAFAACDPTHENISNGSHISLDELVAKTTVKTDIDPITGQNGNVIICETLAPVTAKFNIGGKDFVGNYAKRKMKTGTHEVVLTALCPDGTVLTNSYQIECQQVTDPLQKFYIYGDVENFPEQVPFSPGNWSGATCRFSSTEAQHFPTISDDVYFGLKTLIVDISNANGTTILVNNGWWSTTYYDDVALVDGPNEIQLTEQIAKDCAKGNDGEGKDLQFIFKSGGECTINSVYYEE